MILSKQLYRKSKGFSSGIKPTKKERGGTPRSFFFANQKLQVNPVGPNLPQGVIRKVDTVSVLERIIANTIRECQTPKIFTAPECACTNGIYTFRKGNTGHAVTVLECLFTNPVYPVRNDHVPPRVLGRLSVYIAY